MRGIVPAWATRADVNEEGGGGESVRPKATRHVCMEEEGADAIVEGAKDAFSLAVLL